MGKFGTYIAIMTGLTILFYFAGLLQNTASSTLLNLLLNPADFQLNTLAVAGLAIFSAVAVGAIIVGVFSSVNTELVAMGTFTIFFVSLMWDFLAVVATVYSANQVFGVILLSPMMVIYVLSTIEWWRAVTT